MCLNRMVWTLLDIQCYLSIDRGHGRTSEIPLFAPKLEGVIGKFGQPAGTANSDSITNPLFSFLLLSPLSIWTRDGQVGYLGEIALDGRRPDMPTDIQGLAFDERL